MNIVSAIIITFIKWKLKTVGIGFYMVTSYASKNIHEDHTKNDNSYPFGTKSGQFVHMGSMLKSSLESTCSVDKFSQKSDAGIDAERSLTCLDR